MKNLYPFFKKLPKFQLLVVSDDKEALRASWCAEFFNIKPFVLPDLRANFGDDLMSFSDELLEISEVLGKFYESNESKVLISPIRTISFHLPKKENFDSMELFFGDRLNLAELKNKLFRWGYYFVDIVTDRAEASFRGDIIDIFPIGYDHAFRISLFDTDVESIRKFDPATQKSDPVEIESIAIRPQFLALSEEQLESIDEKIANSKSDSFIKDIHSLGFWFLDDLGEYYPLCKKTFITQNALAELDEVYIFEEKRLPKEEYLKLNIVPSDSKFNEVKPTNINEFIDFHKDKKLTIIASNEARVKQFDLNLSDSKINYIFSNSIINLLSQDELILSLNFEVKKKRKIKPNIVLDELKVGDLVVHQDYGIGKFLGIEPITVLGATKDFLKILYSGDDKLFVPVENITLVDRFVADSGSLAELDKLGKATFAKLKEKVKDKLFAIATDITNLAAIRELSNGIKMQIDKRSIELFQSKSGFAYTKDQSKSINEIFGDLSSGIVMDRLLSGDVGFGKTEVAMNAIFASFLNSYQSILMAPTTLLAHQHFLTFKDRFEEFGVKIAKIDSRCSAKEKSSVAKALKDGTVDVVVGTHSLLGVECKKLGLIIVDEEHKFGVKQKEKLKTIQKDVHLLSMSATPIPRTLNLALSKLKGMSALLTPPSERQGVRTYLKEYDEKIIKEIILREKRRGGQLFYVYNNISTIELKKSELLKIFPNLKIETIHSQLESTKADEVIFEFASGKIDILVATSIIESGLHLPNANTIIIDGADRFGIADLHQLRGRVGRGAKEGFCYFLVEDKNRLTSEAIKRLVALEKNSYLGSGTALAHQDLEIRGGGNILGEAQSGHIKQIGYALYLKMLEEALLNLSGQAVETAKNVDIKLAINAYISSDYVFEDSLRLELYRRFGKAKTKNEVFEIEEEMIDRYGKSDIYTKQFISIILIKISAINLNIVTINNFEQNITFVFGDGKKETVKSSSKDDDDLISATLAYLKKLEMVWFQNS